MISTISTSQGAASWCASQGSRRGSRWVACRCRRWGRSRGRSRSRRRGRSRGCSRGRSRGRGRSCSRCISRLQHHCNPIHLQLQSMFTNQQQHHITKNNAKPNIHALAVKRHQNKTQNATYSNPRTQSHETHGLSTKDHTSDSAYLTNHTTVTAANNVHTAEQLQTHCRICSCIPSSQTNRITRHNHQPDQLTTQPACSLCLQHRAHQQHVFSVVNRLVPFALL